jgi:hypothetical protein
MSEKLLPLHFKFLTTPEFDSADIDSQRMLDSLREVLESSGAEIRVELRSTEKLRIPQLGMPRVGACSESFTSDQRDLFSNRNEVGSNEIVIYFVDQTRPPNHGCGSFPPGLPGAIVTKGATRWTLAHEIGHLVGITHVNNNKRLMTGNGTRRIVNPPPNLLKDEVSRIANSLFVREV